MKSPIDIAMRNFRAQPILCASTKQVRGLELLARHRLDFSDPNVMLAADIHAMEMASLLAKHYKGEIRIHCNAEIPSLQSAEWMEAMLANIQPGVVVELVERNENLDGKFVMERFSISMMVLKRVGARIALDDWTGTEIECRMLKDLTPEIVKVNEPQALRLLASQGIHPRTALVVEQIETREAASMAQTFGATELQGYWCDLLVEHDLPAAFTPPGVMARDAMAFMPYAMVA